VTQRDLDFGRDPQRTVEADLEAEARIDAEREIEAGARGGDNQ
jgi:hypothetical protein